MLTRGTICAASNNLEVVVKVSAEYMVSRAFFLAPIKKL